MRVEEKVPGGKMVCVDVEVADGRISRIKITGDFFLHPEKTIDEIERTLVGASINQIARKVADVLKENDAQFIGVSPEDIERLAKRAV